MSTFPSSNTKKISTKGLVLAEKHNHSVTHSTPQIGGQQNYIHWYSKQNHLFHHLCFQLTPYSYHQTFRAAIHRKHNPIHNCIIFTNTKQYYWIREVPEPVKSWQHPIRSSDPVNWDNRKNCHNQYSTCRKVTQLMVQHVLYLKGWVTLFNWPTKSYVMPSLTAESKPCNLLAPYYTHYLKREKNC